MSGLFAVELEPEARVAGGVLRGRVRLGTRDDPRVAGLREVNVLVRAHVHSDESDEYVVAFRDELSARGVVADEYPFECPLPDGPVSRAGHLFAVEWEVKLRVVFERGDDLVERVPFRLLPREVLAPAGQK